MPEKDTGGLPWDKREPRKFVLTDEFKERCELLLKASPHIYYLVVYPLLKAWQESEQEAQQLKAEKLLTRWQPRDPSDRSQ
jgi:hypothetical protein